jgi:hypothetical protein
MHSLIVVGVVAMLSAAAVAQDAVKTLPEYYRVTFENEYVRVTRVHYPAYAKLPGHTHTSLPTAYVYLNDSGPVAFKHIGLEYGAVTRPPTVARSYRLFRGLEEIHEVENLSDRPSEFLRVEFKTDPGADPRTLRGKFMPPTASAEPIERVEFENAQVRIARVLVPSGRRIELAAAATPSVLVTLSGHDIGHASFVPKGRQHVIAADSHPAEVLRFQLKTDVTTR